MVETTRDLGDTRTLTLRLAPGGGYAATLSLKKKQTLRRGRQKRSTDNSA